MWHEQPDGSVTFHRLPPTDEDVEVLVVRIVRRVARLLARRDADAAIDDELDTLDHAQAEAVQMPLTFAEPRSQISTTSRRLAPARAPPAGDGHELELTFDDL